MEPSTSPDRLNLLVWLILASCGAAVALIAWYSLLF